MEDADGSKIKEAEAKYHNEEVKEEGLVEVITPEQSSSYVTQVESLISDLKNLSGGTEEALPTSDKGAGEVSEPAKPEPCEETAAAVPRELEKDDLDETARGTHTQQPLVGSQASWKNCCGLLDFLRRSDQ